MTSRSRPAPKLMPNLVLVLIRVGPSRKSRAARSFASLVGTKNVRSTPKVTNGLQGRSGGMKLNKPFTMNRC